MFEMEEWNVKKLALALMSLLAVRISTEAKQAEPPKETALKGKAVFKGAKAPKRRKIDTGADPVCSKIHEADPLLSETVVVNDDGSLRNVFVYVKDGFGDRKFDPPKEAAVLNQKGCHYEPHILGIMVGQTLAIRNSDETMHNIHGTPATNSEFNFSQAKKGQEDTRVFNQVEIMIPIKCDVHGWMNSFIGVVSNPFYGVTGDGGKFELKGLPPGKYTIAAWHEKFGTQEQVVTVGEKETKEIEFSFGEK